MILDGHHRLLKAINNNIETIKARVLDLSTAPKLYQSMFGYKNKKK
jgi:ParB-like chromosome segregation protein Spo0J